MTALAIVGLVPGLVLAGYSASKDSAADVEFKLAPAAPGGFPCTGYPSKGVATPADTPLPTIETDGKSGYTTGTVEGPTSYFGGPYDSPDAFALTQQWIGATKAPLPPQGQEFGATPCDNTQPGTNCTLTQDVSPKALNYCSYYAAMRFSPTENFTVTTDFTAYDKSVPPQGPFHQWAGNPLTDELSTNLSWLYGRQLKVTRKDNNKSVIVRAVDRGPGTNPTPSVYDTRPIDLSPWAVGALADDPACIAFDGAKGTPAGDAFNTKCDWTNTGAATPNVSIEWVVDNNQPLGPVK
ncbi:hypothetical protein [Mycolicibacterium sp.]|uniref:hypothetical protein n=1 Tax=Mycolicibacterium sp. TaxID=2320850 RepID=UPI003D0F6793